MGRTNSEIIKEIIEGKVHGEPPTKALGKREARRRVKEIRTLYHEINLGREPSSMMDLEEIIYHLKNKTHNGIEEIRARFRYEKGIIIDPWLKDF